MVNVSMKAVTYANARTTNDVIANEAAEGRAARARRKRRRMRLVNEW